MQWNFWEEVVARANPVKVKLRNLRPSPVRHEKLPDKLVERIKNVYAILEEVEWVPLQKAIYDFRKDMHPEREVVVWERIAEKYQRRVKAWWPINKKKELLGKLLQESSEETPIVIGPAPEGTKN